MANGKQRMIEEMRTWERDRWGLYYWRPERGETYKVNKLQDGLWALSTWSPATGCWHYVASFQTLRAAKARAEELAAG